MLPIRGSQYSNLAISRDRRGGSEESFSSNTVLRPDDDLTFHEPRPEHNTGELSEDDLGRVGSPYVMVNSTKKMRRTSTDAPSATPRRNSTGPEDRLSQLSPINDPTHVQPSITISNKVLPAEFLARLKAASAARKNIVGWRDGIAAARRQHRQQRHRVSKCVKEFEDIASEFISMVQHAIGATDDTQAKLLGALESLKHEDEKLLRVEKELREREDGLDSAELKLSSHERQLSRKERAILREELNEVGAVRNHGSRRSSQLNPAEEAIKTPLSSSADRSDLSEDDDDNSYAADPEHVQRASLYAFSGSSSSSPSLSPLEHQYYDEIGNVTLAREHLYNLETDYLQKRYIRDAQRKAGGSTLVPDSHFFQEYFSERKRLIQQYVSSKDLVYRWYKACKEAGIEVEEPNLPPLIARSTLDHSNRAEPDILHSGFVDLSLHRTIVLWNAKVLTAVSSADPDSIWHTETPWSNDVYQDWPTTEIVEGDLDRTAPQSQSSSIFELEELQKEKGGFVSETPYRRYSDPNPFLRTSKYEFRNGINGGVPNQPVSEIGFPV
jgi:hypothetical protein